MACRRRFDKYLLLTIIVIIFHTVGGNRQCTMGWDCFPSGQIPDDLTDKDADYYCCLERNTRRQQNTLPDGSQNCSCVDYFTAEEDMKEWADSNNEGRMCNSGEDCMGVNPISVMEDKFTFCCKTGPGRGSNRFYLGGVDSDKVEYVGCRCSDRPVPAPDPTVYVVPETLTHASTGESCFYNNGCQDYPSLKCQSSAVTFCCYGSRGMVTDNDAQGFTRCTCTNELYGERCEAYPIPIRDREDGRKRCLLDCDDKPAEEKCVNIYNHARCCPDGLNVVATLHKGSFTSCTCSRQRQKNCDADASSATVTGGHLGDVMMTAVMAVYVVGRHSAQL